MDTLICVFVSKHTAALKMTSFYPSETGPTHQLSPFPPLSQCGHPPWAMASHCPARSSHCRLCAWSYGSSSLARQDPQISFLPFLLFPNVVTRPWEDAAIRGRHATAFAPGHMEAPLPQAGGTSALELPPCRLHGSQHRSRRPTPPHRRIGGRPRCPYYTAVVPSHRNCWRHPLLNYRTN
jgi:hypothetical protein